ncbi:MAG: cadherin repeat domain-containing protein [Planctomycetes bacterium]|nr:cadherin repeat domain-containing protein [Planctomycetota bacterium]MCH9724873.1 cadherin repeat domain-containing protein [Planctomycetota bacterium]MCH9776832.1 cadherin repeat domain-containing protein [Planctomycetota bacterium]
MQKREKILAAIFGAVILIWFGMPVIDSTFIEPVESRQNQLNVLNQQIDQREQKELELLRSASQLGNWSAHSLPPDEHDAQRLYLEWLDDLAELSGFSDIQLTPGRRIRERKTYVAVQVTLKGTATYDQICHFLLHFYQTELLQNIIGLELKSTGTSKANPLQVKLTAEGLALNKAKPREELFPRAKLTTTLDLDSTKMKVQNITEFPNEPPFRIRIDREFLTVSEIADDTWTVARGANLTLPAEHKAGTPFELSPLNQFSEGNTKLQASITQDSKLIKVLSTKYFPKDESYLIKIDDEILNVTNHAAGEWSVQRGVLDTKATAHSKGAAVKEVPRYLQAVFDYRLIAPVNPFAKPVPDKSYKLKLKDILKQNVVKGTALELTVPLEGINPSLAAPEVSVKTELPAMTVQSGKLKWLPPEEQKAGVYPVTITAIQGGQTVEKKFQIELLEKNLPPNIEVPSLVTAYQARPLSLFVKASDPDLPSQKLKFELETEAPAGVMLNSETGEINWTPTASTELKDYPMTIKVSDSGTPPLSTSRKLIVKVVLDDAFFTFLTGSIELDGKKIAWIRNRATNQKREVQVGDTIDVSEIHAIVKTITDKFLILEIDGKPWTLSLGENFRTMRNLTSPSVLN